MCASDALIQAMMGVVTDANHKPIIYDHEKMNFTIREGIIIAKNKKVFSTCENRISENIGRKVAKIHEEIIRDYDIYKQQQKLKILKQQVPIFNTDGVAVFDENPFIKR